MQNHHLYLVFNPMINQDSDYKTQAHEFYSQLKNMMLQQQDETPFMYWGKLKVDDAKNLRMEDYRKIISQNVELGLDTHLYITDFHHFWVAKVESVHEEIFNRNRTLSFYDDKEVEVWFKVTDMDLIAAEFEETLFYLSQLGVNNEFHTEKIDSLHPYLGNLKFPMIVEDKSEERFFQGLHVGQGPRLVRNNPLVEHSLQSANMRSHMKSFVLSPQVFSKLPHNAKTELLSAELAMSRDGFSTPAVLYQSINSYFHVLESVLNLTVVRILKDQFGKTLSVTKDGSEFTHLQNENTIVLDEFTDSVSVAAIVKLYESQKSFGNIDLESLETICPSGMQYFSKSFLPFIQNLEIVAKIQALTNGEYFPVNKAEVIQVRNQILGVGCLGVINSLVSLLFSYEENNYLQNAS